MGFETGMRPGELCRLRLSDVDREQGVLKIRGQGSTSRWIPLGPEGLRSLLAYLDHCRLETISSGKRRRVGEESLFLAETGHALTENSISLVFGQFRKRAGMTSKDVGPSLLRDSFAVRYLQAGGDLCTLRELLGQEESTRVKRYLGMKT